MKDINIKTFITVNGIEYCISTTWLSRTIPLYETMVFRSMDRQISDYAEISVYTNQYRDEESAIKGHYQTIREMLLN